MNTQAKLKHPTSTLRTPGRRILCYALAASASAILPVAVRAAEARWNNTGTDFNSNASWSITSPGVPTSGDYANFLNPAVTQPNVSSSLTIQQVRFALTGSGHTLTGSPGTALTLTNTGTHGTQGGPTGAALTFLSGSNTVGVDLVLGAAASATQTFTTSVSYALVSGNVSALNSGMTLTHSGVASSVLEISGTIGASGSANMSVRAAGPIVRLSNHNNAYTGATLISTVLEASKLSNGSLPSSIGASGSGAANLTLSQGTLRYVGTGDSTDRLATFGGTAFSTLDSSGSGPVHFTNTGTPAVTSSTRGLTLGGTNTGNNILAWTLTGTLSSGVNRLQKDGVGTWNLTGNNSYQSTTVINNGLLQIGNGGSSGNLTGTSQVTVNSPGTLGFFRNDTFTFNRNIDGAGAVAQNGSGKTILSGTRTYTGATRVNAGTLELNGGSHTAGTGSSYVISGGDFIHAAGDWATDLFHVNGSGNNIDLADLAFSPSGDSEIRYTVDTAGVSTINFTDADPFGHASYAGDASAWAADWNLYFLAPGLTKDDFTDLNLMSSSGGFDILANLNGLITFNAYTAEGAPFAYANVTNGQTIYIAGTGSVAAYTVSMTADSFDLIFSSSRAIPEPSVLGLLAMAGGMLSRRFRIKPTVAK